MITENPGDVPLQPGNFWGTRKACAPTQLLPLFSLPEPCVRLEEWKCVPWRRIPACQGCLVPHLENFCIPLSMIRRPHPSLSLCP